MSKFDPDDYEEKLKYLEQRHEILAAWIVMVFVALLFIGLESFLAGAHHVVWHRHAFAPGIAFVDPSAGSIAAMRTATATLSRSSIVCDTELQRDRPKAKVIGDSDERDQIGKVAAMNS